MPKIANPEATAATTPKAEPPKRPPLLKKAAERLVKYPEPEVQICDAETPLTAEKAMRILGWENERAYAERIKSENPKAKESQLKYGDDWLLKDAEGLKVRCSHNNVSGGATNRPFDESWAWSLAQVILNKQYAPDGWNGETVIVGKTGLVLSGQHRLIGLVLASMVWGGFGKVGRAQKDHWREIWETEPTIETLVVFGVSEADASVMTLDNVKPRSPSDVFYTSAHFARLDAAGRAECSRMLDKASALFWKRTGSATVYDKFMTTQALISLVDRHPKLLKAISVIFGANVTKALNCPEFKLSPGQCSAMLYLMAASATDGERNGSGQIASYAHADPAPSEKRLDMSRWDKAERFFLALANGDARLKEVRYRLTALNENAERPASSREKLAVLAQAWATWVTGGKITEATCKLEYVPNENGEQVLKETPSVGGIDLGDPKEAATDPDEPGVAETIDQAEQKRIIREEQARKLMEARAKGGKGESAKQKKGEVNGDDPKGQSASDALRTEFMAIKEDHPGLLLLIRHKSGGLSAYNGDAAKLAAVMEVKIKEPKDGSMPSIKIADKDLDGVIVRLLDAGIAAAIVEKDAEGRYVAAEIGAEDPEVGSTDELDEDDPAEEASDEAE